MQPPSFWDEEIKQEIAVIHYLGLFSILQNHKLHRKKDLYIKHFIKYFDLYKIQCSKII